MVETAWMFPIQLVLKQAEGKVKMFLAIHMVFFINSNY